MENTDLCKNNLPLIHDNANGFSLLETVIAISLITLAASVTIQTIYISDTTQINATIAQRDWAEMTNLSAYIHKAFNEDRLVIDNITFQLVDTALPDFISAESLEIRPIAGTQTRYLDNQPACILTDNATLSPAEIAFTTDCLSTDNGSSIAHAIHTVWQQGAPIIFGIAGSSGLCVQQSAPSQTDAGRIAYLMVRDADCLQDANGTPSQIAQEILFPRFMVFSKDFPDQFHFALFEPIAHQTEGATLALPEMHALARLSLAEDTDNTRWIRGWLGGADNDTEGDWKWLSGAQKGQIFWKGNGANGEPVDTDGQPASVNSRTTHLIGFDDPQTNPSFPLGQLEPLLDNTSQNIHFTAWGRREGTITYPDNQTASHDYLVMSVDSDFRSLWANHPADETCIDSNDENALFTPCGYFLQWAGKDPETEPVLAIRRDILLSDQQDICP